MTSEVHMPGPVCLIENVKGQLVANQEALRILSAIKQPVVVVAIVGLYHTGKSYLMNKLAWKNTGFSVGSTVDSHTKGIWMWCVPHPQKPGHTLVLLDTEGLGNVEKGDNQNDCWIFALAVLLSSTFVYNSMGTINQQALDQLHYVTELADRIRTRSSLDHNELEDLDEFVNFFPDFVWTLRDFSLELKVNGKPISADEYLENSLRLIQDTCQREIEQKFNLPRFCIHKFFPKKKCFVFERPAHRKKLGQLESLQDQDLDSNFVKQVSDFCSYVFSCSKVKTISGGIKVNGPRLKSLVITYVNAISSGGLPCIENAVLALPQTENEAEVQKTIAHYDQQMSQKLQLPTETLHELMDVHRAREKEAIKTFRDNSFEDVDQVFPKALGVIVSQLKGTGSFNITNVKAVTLDMSCLLIRDSAEEALQNFLQSKEDLTDAILQPDQTLIEKQKEFEVDDIKAEVAQATEKILEKMQQKYDQQLKEKEKNYQEHLKQLTEKMEKAQAHLIEEQQMIVHSLQEQTQLIKDGFQQIKIIQDEIMNLQERKPKQKWHHNLKF
ncbi:guanylate-binding protein 1-like [Microtus pennsylvanicus]|uniref:guanylate-binding protein 1-like n=1 Tax=Microtus pennsylvanicus TaxID=10058 RepID=UPI003F6D90AE